MRVALHCQSPTVKPCCAENRPCLSWARKRRLGCAIFCVYAWVWEGCNQAHERFASSNGWEIDNKEGKEQRQKRVQMPHVKQATSTKQLLGLTTSGIEFQ